MGKKHRLQAFAVMLICVMCITGGPMGNLVAFANLDPSLLNPGGNADAGDDDSASYEDGGDDESEADKSYAAEESAASKTSKYDLEISRINTRLNDLDSEKKQIQASINAAKTAKEKEIFNKQNLDRQIGITSDEISLLENRVALLEQNIVIKGEEIKLQQAQIDHTYETFKTRLRVMQMSDDTTTLGLLLGADSFSDFLGRAQMVSRIAEHDQTLMESLTTQRKEMEAAKRSWEADQVAILGDKEETERKKQTLNTQSAAISLAIQDLAAQEQEFLADLEANKRKADQMEQALENIYAQMKYDENPYVGGELLWPVPGAYKITSGYGMRFNNTNMHTGIDITYNGGGTHGAAVVAANDGTVSFVNWAYTQNQGYGIYLIIDHGGRVSTLYAHLSNITVGLGDKVKKGQTVGAVGNTGWSTGPHLHFEVRENGVHKPPLNYLTK